MFSTNDLPDHYFNSILSHTADPSSFTTDPPGVGGGAAVGISGGGGAMSLSGDCGAMGLSDCAMSLSDGGYGAMGLIGYGGGAMGIGCGAVGIGGGAVGGAMGIGGGDCGGMGLSGGALGGAMGLSGDCGAMGLSGGCGDMSLSGGALGGGMGLSGAGGGAMSLSGGGGGGGGMGLDTMYYDGAVGGGVNLGSDITGMEDTIFDSIKDSDIHELTELLLPQEYSFPQLDSDSLASLDLATMQINLLVSRETFSPLLPDDVI
ncbi:hypothetical protein Pmani_014811 [Petrolisthes manimaculis]|uniref:Uncharacterized protein n=1 Tax=Petrolisthes manimaculis TaxID=1843537 RepID=A0AAE1U802_9EUCA|nr:hypothetical protein Pmani_014811 [Petrolisthes manimaculis]